MSNLANLNVVGKAMTQAFVKKYNENNPLPHEAPIEMEWEKLDERRRECWRAAAIEAIAVAATLH